ncbi:hypothetical protein C823_007007 [Eubacterium plexicaudatum ASF492]|nr:hypothetical protein C823_007007 [Eubacterium plexicaudatum ASF492]
MEAMTSDLLIPLIRNNFGIGFVPEMLAHPLLQRQILVHVPLACDLPERKICLVFDKDRARNPVSVELQKYLKNIFYIRINDNLFFIQMYAFFVFNSRYSCYTEKR